MFICNCNALNTKDVEVAIRVDGAKTAQDIHAIHGCEMNCGRCTDEMQKMIHAFGDCPSSCTEHSATPEPLPAM